MPCLFYFSGPHTRTHDEGGSLNKEVKSRRPVWPCPTMTTLTTPSNMSNLFNIAHYGRSVCPQTGTHSISGQTSREPFSDRRCQSVFKGLWHGFFKTLSSRTPKRLEEELADRRRRGKGSEVGAWRGAQRRTQPQ